MVSRQNRRIQRELEETFAEANATVMFRVFQIMNTSSPVRFGFFRAGWTMSSGAPDRSSPALPPTNVPGEVESLARTLRAEHASGAQEVRRGYVFAQGPIWVVNNVRYGIYLNDGSSSQAPAMFVEKGVVQAVAETQRTFRPRF